MSLAPLVGSGPQTGISQASQKWEALDDTTLSAETRGAGDGVTLEIVDRAPGDEDLLRNSSHRYTLNVTNEGGVQDTFDLTFTSENADWKGTLEMDNVTLEASDSTELYFEARTPHDGAGDNTYNITAISRNNGDNYDYKELNLLVDMSYAVDMEPPKDGNESSSVRGSKVTYKVRIMNTGQNLDSYDLRAEGTPLNWKVKVEPTSASDVGQGEARSIWYNVTVPENAAQNEFAKIKIIATSQTHANIEAFKLTKTTASDGRIYGVDLAVMDSNRTSTIAGGSPVFSLEVTNDGNESDSFDVSYGELAPYWTASLTSNRIYLAPGATKTVDLQVTAPANASLGDKLYLEVTAASRNRSVYMDDLETVTTVREPSRAVMVTITPATKDAGVGASVVYLVNVTNKGLDPDDIDLEVNSAAPAGWVFQLAQATILELGVNESYFVNLTVSVPSDALAGTEAWGNVTVTSANDAGATDTAPTKTKAITVPAFTVTLLPPNLNTYPGHETAMMVQVNNVGNVEDSYDVEVFDLPSKWASSLASPTIDDVPVGFSDSVLLEIDPHSSSALGYYRFNLTVTSQANDSLVRERTVIVQLEQYAEFDFTPQTYSQQVEPSNNLSFTFELKNVGPDQDNASLSVKNMETGWKAQFFDQGTDIGKVVTLASGAKDTLTLEIPIGAHDAPGNYTLTLRATPANNFKLFTEMPIYLEILPNQGFEISRTTHTTSNAQANTSYTEQVRVSNLGNLEDTYMVVNPTLPEGWTVEVDPANPFTLAGGANKVVTIIYTTAVDPQGGKNSFPIKFNSTSNPGLEATFTWNIDFPQTYGVEILLEDYPFSSLKPGSYPKAFVLRVTNTGNGLDSFNLTLEGNTASWFNRSQVEVQLTPGEQKDISFDLTIPAGTLAKDYQLSAKVTSLGDVGKTKTVTQDFSVSSTGTTGGDDDDTDDDDDDGGGFLPGPGLVGLLAMGLLAAVLVGLRRRH